VELAVAGFQTCPYHQRALEAAKGMVAQGIITKLDDRTFATRDQYREWLFSEGQPLFADDEAVQKHISSPFVWSSSEGLLRFVGGCDDVLLMAAPTSSLEQAGMIPSTGDRVHVAYKGTLKRDGSVFDTSEGKEPLRFMLGSGQVISGFEEAIASMSVGDKKIVELSPAHAYGERSDEAIMSFPKSAAPDGLEVGQQVRLSAGGVATVIELNEETVRIDANPRLAGETLIFDLELLSITPAAEVEEEEASGSNGIISKDAALPGRDNETPLPDNSHYILKNPMRPPYAIDGLEVAVVATGCFWGTEKGFWRLPGVYSSAVGYALVVFHLLRSHPCHSNPLRRYINGHTPNPTYEEVCTQQTGHTEACQIVFDSGVIGFGDILKQVGVEARDGSRGQR
jgi:FKBP-type peptidyl-prolyl cis-trans isomerase 2